jgi:NO-binding membrane sensor protein with MHYT domain
MGISSVLSIFSILLPFVAMFVILWKYIYTKRTEILVMIPSLLYIAVYYGFFLWATHFMPNFEIQVLQIPFRIGVILILSSILIQNTYEAISLKILNKKHTRDIEEKP